MGTTNYRRLLLRIRSIRSFWITFHQLLYAKFPLGYHLIYLAVGLHTFLFPQILPSLTLFMSTVLTVGIFFLLLLILMPIRIHYLFVFFLGLIVSWVYKKQQDSHYQRHLGNGSSSFVQAILIVKDSRLWKNQYPQYEHGSDHSFLRPRVEIIRIRFSQDTEWIHVQGYALWNNPPSNLSYGTILEVEGSLLPLSQPPQLPQQKINPFIRMANLTGLTHQLTTCKVQPSFFSLNLLSNFSIRIGRGIFTCRNWILHQLEGSGLSEQSYHFLSALLFGLKTPFSFEERELFRFAGVIHIFAVSGFHVGIIFSFCLLIGLVIFRFPPRWCWFWIPWIILPYVMMTGESASAWRAWVMLTFWNWSRACYLPQHPLNTLAGAAAILLIFRPFAYWDPGFQYSFLLVLAMSISWQKIQHLIQSLRAHTLLRVESPPTIYSFFREYGFNFILHLIGINIVFWLAGFGLTSYYYQLFLPAALVLNCVYAIAVSWMMGIGIFHILLNVIPGFSCSFLSPILNSTTEWLFYLAEVSAQPEYWKWIPQYSLILLYGYYFTLLIWISGIINSSLGNRIFFLLFLLSFCTILVFPRSFHQSHEVEIYAISPPGNSAISLLIFTPQQEYLIHPGTKHQAKILQDWLFNYRGKIPSSIILLNRTTTFASGLYNLLHPRWEKSQIYLLAWNNLGPMVPFPDFPFLHITTIKASAQHPYFWEKGMIEFFPLQRASGEETCKLIFGYLTQNNFSIFWERQSTGIVKIIIQSKKQTIYWEFWRSNEWQIQSAFLRDL